MRMRVFFSMIVLAALCSAGNLWAGHWEVQVKTGIYTGTPQDFTCLGPTDTCFVRYIWVADPIDTNVVPIDPGTVAIYVPKEERGYVNAQVSMMLEKDGALRVTVSGDKRIEVYSREELLKYLEALRSSEGKQ
jgi:hypothetical protein